MSSSRVTSYSRLVYPAVNIVYFQFERVHIAPLSTGYSHFSLLSPLPSSLSFHTQSGTLSGQLTEPLPLTNITVVAENMIDHSQSSFTFQLEGRGIGIRGKALRIVGCDANHTIVLLEKVNTPFSQIECWNISSASTKYVEQCGHPSFGSLSSNQSVQSVYYCLPLQTFRLSSFVDSSTIRSYQLLQDQNPGMITVKLPIPRFFAKDYDYPLVNLIKFEAIADLSIPGECIINPVYSIAAGTEWKVAVDEECGYGWERESFDDRAWRSYSIAKPYISRKGRNLFWRSWFDVDDVSKITNIEMKIRHSCKLSVWINGVHMVSTDTQSKYNWSTITMHSEALHHGSNLIALQLSNLFYTFHTSESQNDSYFVFSFILRLAMELDACSRPMDMSVSGDAVAGYDASNLISKSMVDYWKSGFSYGKAIVSFSMKDNSKYMINKYCITSSSGSALYDPIRWTLWFRFDNNQWDLVNKQSKITWTSRLQTQCFVVPSENRYTSAVTWKVEQQDRQQYVQAARISFHVVNLDVASQLPFEYEISELNVFVNIPIRTICPKYLYFDSFKSNVELPKGLIINSGTGCISGSATDSFTSTNITINAVNMKKKIVSTIYTFNYIRCQFPLNTLRVELLPTIQDFSSSFSVDIGVFDSAWKLIRFSSSSLSEKEPFTQCLPVDSYHLMLLDETYQGSLTSSYLVLQNKRMIAKGFINPGFPQIWVNAVVRDDWNQMTPWYYDFSEQTPKSDWYKEVDASGETWSTAIPGEFPWYSGVTQYYKTVLELSDISSLSEIVFYITLHAGFVLYVNGEEQTRWNLPDGVLTHETRATNYYMDDIEYKVVVPYQFSSLKQGRNVIAVEMHEHQKPETARPSTFRLDTTFGTRMTAALLDATVIDMSSTQSQGTTVFIKELNDGNYYSCFYSGLKTQNHQVHFFSLNGNIEFVSSFTLFFGDQPGAYPREITLYGRKLQSLQEMEVAKAGGEVENRKWIKLLELTNIEIFSIGLGKFREYPFYNEYSFNEYRFVLSNKEVKNGFEIAELKFQSQRIAGFCNIREILPDSATSDFTSYVPSYNWYLAPCPPLYHGSIQHFCYEGNWTETLNLCRCDAPSVFFYPVSIWRINRKTAVSILPTVVGAELEFILRSQLPGGLELDEFTGEIRGEVKVNFPLFFVEIEAVNLEGSLLTTIGIISVNNDETVMVLIAIAMVAVLVMLLGLLTKLLHQHRTSGQGNPNSKLHVEVLPESLRSLIL